MTELAYSYRKATRGPPGLTSPSERWITIKNTYDTCTAGGGGGLGFNQVDSGAETNN